MLKWELTDTEHLCKYTTIPCPQNDDPSYLEDLRFLWPKERPFARFSGNAALSWMDPEILYSRHHPRSHHRLQGCRLNHHHYHHRHLLQKNFRKLAGRCLLDWGHHWLFVFYHEAFWMHSLLLLRQKKNYQHSLSNLYNNIITLRPVSMVVHWLMLVNQ